jgi:hypothetical protein
LARDYCLNSYDKTSFHDYYKWCITVASINEHLWEQLGKCPYDLPEELKPFLFKSIRISGPRVIIDFEMAWKMLLDCPYELPYEIKPFIHEALLIVTNREAIWLSHLAIAEKKLAEVGLAEKKLADALEELEAAERNLNHALARVDHTLVTVEHLKSQITAMKKI